MKFFVAKMTYLDGDLAYPWTVFAESFAEAVKRLETGSKADEFSEIVVKELQLSAAGFYGRDPSDPKDAALALEHLDLPWS